MYRFVIFLLCLISAISAAVIQSENPKYQKLVDLAAQDAANGKDYQVRGVFESATGDQENEYTVRLELQDPDRLCEVSILDSQPTDENPQDSVQYSVLKKECKEPVHETFGQKTVPRVCAGCPTDIDPNPGAQAAAEFALDHYNSELGEEEKATEVKIVKVQSQVVAGYNYIMVLELIKDGEILETCRTTVWVKSWENFRKVVKMNCSASTAREGREGA